MLRNLNISINGKRDSTDPRVGGLAGEIPTGAPIPPFLLDNVDAGFPNRLYSLRLTTLPPEGVLFLDKASAGFYAGAPVGSFTGTQEVKKYDPGVGLVATLVGEYILRVTSALATVTAVQVTSALVNGARQFSAVVTGDNSPLQEVIWSASGGSISSTGVFTPPAATAVDQVITISATSVQDPEVVGTATVTIAAVLIATITGVLVSPESLTVAGGSTRQLTATVLGENNPSQDVVWSKTGPGALSATGEFIAPVATAATQVTTIKATSANDETKFGTALITVEAVIVDVTAPEVTGVSVEPMGVVLQGGGVQQYSAIVMGNNGPSQSVAWTTTLGAIDADGLLIAPFALATAQIGEVTATSLQDDTKFATATFEIAGVAVEDNFTPSAARTVRILAGRQVFDTGPFWTVNGTLGPVGSKDPNATIDIPFDWSAWLADIGDPALSAIDFLLSPGLVSPGAVAMRSNGKLIGAAVLVSEGTVGSGNNNSGVHTITCRITTATEPARTEDRTVVLQIKEQ